MGLLEIELYNDITYESERDIGKNATNKSDIKTAVAVSNLQAMS